MKKLRYKGYTFFGNNDGYYRNGKTTLHRFKYEEKHGSLLPCFQLHHKDCNRLNNNFSNLELLTPKEHALVHKMLRRKMIFHDQMILFEE